MSVRILLVDDHKIIREGLKALLEREQDFQVVAEADDGNTAVRLAREVKPDVVIMDVGMPNCNGVDATTQIRAEVPEARIVALTMHSDKTYLTGMLRAGTVGYLLKDCAAEELVKAVRQVMEGKGYISPEIAPLIFEDYSGVPPVPADAAPELSQRERQVLQFLAEGLSPHDIAERLEVSVKTIDRARAHVMEKLKLFSVAELTKYAVRKGISPLTQGK